MVDIAKELGRHPTGDAEVEMRLLAVFRIASDVAGTCLFLVTVASVGAFVADFHNNRGAEVITVGGIGVGLWCQVPAFTATFSDAVDGLRALRVSYLICSSQTYVGARFGHVVFATGREMVCIAAIVPCEGGT